MGAGTCRYGNGDFPTLKPSCRDSVVAAKLTAEVHGATTSCAALLLVPRFTTCVVYIGVS